MPLFLIFRSKIAQKHQFMQFLATFDQIAAYTLLCMASKMDRMQLFIIFQGNNCTNLPFYAIVVRKKEQQLHIQFFGYHPAQLKTPPEDRSEGAVDQY